MSLKQTLVDKMGTPDIYSACQALAAKHFSGRSRDRAIALDALAKEKNIAVKYSDSLAFEGMIERAENGSATISLRRGLNRRRERFTFAHELGHWLLQEEMLGTTEGQLFRGLARNPAELRDEEYLANLLAAELLLPAGEVAELFSRERPIDSLVTICRKYAVSRTMAVRRIADVMRLNIAFLQIMPYDLCNKDSIAQIDDAIFASSESGTLFDREGSRFGERYRFSDIVKSRSVTLRLCCAKGNIAAVFHTQFRPDPVMHAFALVTLDAWPNAREAFRECQALSATTAVKETPC